MGVDLSDLPGVLWDPRVRALRAPARHHRAIRDELARRAVRFAELPLRPYQDAAHWAWQRAGRRGVIVLPTGSGKTRLAIAAMARARRPALALVPTRVLLAQWVREISSAFGGPVGCLGDGERRVEAITVATFESGWRQMDRLGNRFELLIVDEVHHFTGDPIFPSSEPRRFDSSLEERFARDFARLARDWVIIREPEPVDAGGRLFFPDFAVHPRLDPSRRWFVEIVGFWTPEYIANKLERLRRARISNLVLCIDAERNVADSDVPSNAAVVRYRRRVDAAKVLEIVARPEQ